MATLRNPKTAQETSLCNEHTVGRSRSCLLQLTDRRASGHHALLRWGSEHWEILDLGSRNGLWVNDQKLQAGQRQVLRQGDRIGFGSRENTWELTDSSAPPLMALGPDGQWRLADEGLLALPSPDEPLAIVYADDQGRWVIEQDGAASLLDGRDPEVLIGGARWQIRLPAAIAGTYTTAAVMAVDALLSLTFFVSQDEEDIEIELRQGGVVTRIPHRAQSYMLLTLARARAEDASEGLAPSEQGWRYGDELARALRIPSNQFNVAIYRARQHLQKAGLADARRIIERRRGSGQLRLGVHNVRIESM